MTRRGARLPGSDGSQELYSFDHTNADPRMRGRLWQKELTAAAGFPSPSRIVWRGQYEPQYQLLVAEQNEQGALTRYRYDFDVTPAAPSNTGKLVELIQPAVTLPSGATQQSRTRYAHNNRGQLTEVILPDGTRNQFEYEAAGPHRGALIKTTSDAGVLGVERRIAYDVHGYPSTITEGNGNQGQQSFNALGRLETAIPSGGTSVAAVEYQYDADGFLVPPSGPPGATRTLRSPAVASATSSSGTSSDMRYGTCRPSIRRQLGSSGFRATTAGARP